MRSRPGSPARQYALTIDEIAHKTPSMSLPEASDNEGRTRAALTEQNRLIDEQASPGEIPAGKNRRISVCSGEPGLDDR
ncbi:phage tail tape measure protein [Escherichia coli]|uniref:phage tail tape measure protein n=1 Tax=Escherichia coli TaxID=562 RepID=UPI00373AF393